MRISERKRTTRTPDTSKSANSNTETQRNNQRSLLEGGVGSRQVPVSALSLKVAIRSGGGKQPHYPSRVRANSNPWRFGYGHAGLWVIVLPSEPSADRFQFPPTFRGGL